MPGRLPGWMQRRGMAAWLADCGAPREEGAEVGWVSSPESLSRGDACSWWGEGPGEGGPESAKPGLMSVSLAGRAMAEDSGFSHCLGVGEVKVETAALAEGRPSPLPKAPRTHLKTAEKGVGVGRMWRSGCHRESGPSCPRPAAHPGPSPGNVRPPGARGFPSLPPAGCRFSAHVFGCSCFVSFSL